MKKINVGFEFSRISPEHGGVFQYSFYILRLLKEIDEIDTIYIFCSEINISSLDEFRKQEKFKLIKVKTHGFVKKRLKKVSEFVINRYLFRFDKSKLLFKLYYQLNPDISFFNSFKLNILHIPWQISPVFGIKASVIVTIHDLIQLHFPEFFGPIQRYQRSVIFTKNILMSDQIISSFEHVKKDVQKYFLVGDNQTSVCPVPLSTEGFAAKTFSSFKKLVDIYNIPNEFILTPAATWPHKNHIGMLHALKILKDRERQVYWVTTGAKQEYYHKVIEPLIKKLDLSQQVQFTDIVSQEDLIGFYKTTKLVVMPTLYEAGSGPLFESMRFGVPVICSNVTSLPASIENPEFVFNPRNYGQIADMIELALDDDDYRKRNVKNSKSRLEYYSKFNYKLPILEAYQKAIENKKSFD